MATSETEICNLALVRLGHTPITTLSEGTPTADLCNLFYPITRDSLLRSHPWNFAISRATLALSATTPNHEFSYQHTLPADCLKVIRTGWEADGTTSGSAVYGFPGVAGYAGVEIPYRVEGRSILCNETVVKIEYIAKITDVSQFDPLFVTALSLNLALSIGMRLTDNATLVKGLSDEFRLAMVEARMNDATEGTPRDVVDTSGWIVARV